MDGLSAVIFIPDDTAKTGYDRPMLLQNLMGTPMLSWLVDELSAGGVERFFLVCRPQNEAQAKACFPPEVELTCADESQAADQLHVFLSTAHDDERDVLVITGPCILLPHGRELRPRNGLPAAAPMLSVPREPLMNALDGQMDFPVFLRRLGVPYTDRDGVFGVQNLADLTDLQPLVNRCHLSQLARRGVEIWDYQSIFVQPGVHVAPGASLLPGTMLWGRTVVEEGCVIGPNAWIRDSRIGPGSTVDTAHVIRTTLPAGSKIGPYACITEPQPGPPPAPELPEPSRGWFPDFFSRKQG